MPPKVSQLLTRVLAREHNDDGSRSSSSEDDYGLQQMAKNASPGMRMEMEMLRESRARDKADGVDRKACIVDRNQFFNTQVGVGYQHKTVVRQRTVEQPTGAAGQRVVDMSAAAAGGSKGKRRHRQSQKKKKNGRGSDSDGDRSDIISSGSSSSSSSSDDDGDGGGDRKRRRKKKSSKSSSSAKSKSKKRKRRNEKEKSEGHDGKREKKAKKEKRERKKGKSSSHRREGDEQQQQEEEEEEESDNDADKSSRHKRKRKEKKRRKRGEITSSRKTGNGNDDDHDHDDKDDEENGTSSSNSRGEGGREEEGSDGAVQNAATGASLKGSRSMPAPPPVAGGVGERRLQTPAEEMLTRARVPLQQLRDLIEKKIRLKKLKTAYVDASPSRRDGI
eukprot:g10105.t1